MGNSFQTQSSFITASVEPQYSFPTASILIGHYILNYFATDRDGDQVMADGDPAINPHDQKDFPMLVHYHGWGVDFPETPFIEVLRTQLTIESNFLLQQNLIGYLIANLKRNLRGEK